MLIFTFLRLLFTLTLYFTQQKLKLTFRYPQKCNLSDKQILTQ